MYVVEPGDDMPLLCVPMAARAKLRCRRRLNSFPFKVLHLFWRFIGHCAKKTDKINNDGVSLESPLSRWLG